MTGVHTLRIHYLSRRCYTLCPVVRTRCLRACPVLLFEFVTWMSIYRFPLKRVTKFYLVMPTVFSVWVSDVVGSAPFEQIKQNKTKNWKTWKIALLNRISSRESEAAVKLATRVFRMRAVLHKQTNVTGQSHSWRPKNGPSFKNKILRIGWNLNVHYFEPATGSWCSPKPRTLFWIRF